MADNGALFRITSFGGAERRRCARVANFSSDTTKGLSTFEEGESAKAMRDAGASNYLTKSGPAEDLINAIRTGVRPSQKSFSSGTSA